MSIRQIISSNVKRHVVVDSYAELALIKDIDLNAIEAISGHFGVAIERRIINNIDRIICLRNPIDRLYSMYNYWKYNIGSLTSKSYTSMPFREWVLNDDPNIFFEVRNSILWQLSVDRDLTIRQQHFETSESELLKVAFKTIENAKWLGISENLAQDAHELGAIFNWIIPEIIPRLNVTSKQDKLSKKDILAGEQAALYDIQIYNHALQLKGVSP